MDEDLWIDSLLDLELDLIVKISCIQHGGGVDPLSIALVYIK